MFVVKNSPQWDAIDIIAGEMLNRENSIDHFVGGKARTELPQNYVGYPAYVSPTRRYVLKAVGGYIYIPSSISKQWFVKLLINILQEKTVSRLDGQNLTTKCSHRYGVNLSTVVMIGTDNLRRFSITDGKCTDNLKGTTRFMWTICHHTEINTSMLGHSSAITIERLAGIFWDVDDILTLPHGCLTFKFSADSFKADARACREKVTILAGNTPLIFELSDYWRDAVSNTEAKEFMRIINRRKIVSATMDQIEVKPVKVEEDSAATSTEICFRCKDALYGDIYGLSGYLSKQDDPIVTPTGKIIVTPICALCMHTIPEDAPIENKFVRVLRIKWNRETEDIIPLKEFSQEKQDICREILKGVKYCKVKTGEDTESKQPIFVNFYLLGDKYVGFTTQSDFRYTKLVNAPFLEGRTSCKVVVVN